ncbi:Ig-like domain-containing protein [Stappia sp.]|uniref:LysM peptidoglycan-binding domain-containing protein n=1 Tax=Stappia sp. TaxID=1870903 RepID=UPI0032D8C41D
MSRTTVIQLLVLAGIVGAGALGFGLWQAQTGGGGAGDPDAPATARAPDTGSTAEDGTPSGSGDEGLTATAPAPETDAAQAPASGDAPGTDAAQTDMGDTADRADTTTADAGATNAGDGPSFDLMRVEPDGSAVVAGRTEAGAIVALLSNGKVVGKGVANAAGEFAIVLDEPLETGAHAVTLETRDADGAVTARSAQSLTVSVPDTPESGEVLVMLNEPGAPSTILQKPDTIASATPETAPASGDAAADTAVAMARDAAPDAETAANRETETGATAEAGAAPVGDTAERNDVAAPAASPDTGTQTAETTPAQERVTDPQTDVAAADPAATPPDAQTADAASDAQTAAASGTSGPETAAEAPVSVEAVETEEDKVFVAGAGAPNADVRVYLDNTLVGETRTDETGRWLLEADRSVEPGEVDVRADQVTGDTGEVVARAQVTFARAEDAVILRPVAVSGEAGGTPGADGTTGERQIPNVIIRRGDNLWTISQRRYGDGVRYTTIYQANRDQIRDPDLIYPGQVFMLPEGDRNWPAAN